MRNLKLSRSSSYNWTQLHGQNGSARNRLLATLGFMLAALGACTTNEPSSAAPEEIQDRQITAELQETNEMPDKEKHATSKPGPAAYPVPHDIMQKLVNFVANDAGVSAEEVKLERAERSIFSDGSLGCPQPNMGYNQVIVEGYWVVFHVGREEYDMRATNSGGFTRCEGSTKRPPIRNDDT